MSEAMFSLGSPEKETYMHMYIYCKESAHRIRGPERF